jgi:lipid-binding SYLF domain-containing protein
VKSRIDLIIFFFKIAWSAPSAIVTGGMGAGGQIGNTNTKKSNILSLCRCDVILNIF